MAGQEDLKRSQPNTIGTKLKSYMIFKILAIVYLIGIVWLIWEVYTAPLIPDDDPNPPLDKKEEF